MKKHYLLFFLFTAFFAKAQEPFITTWEVTADDLAIGISVFEDDDIPDSFTINFGDGTILSNLSGGATHTYDTPGIYTVSMSGSFSRIVSDFFYADKLKTIEQWGDIQWTDMSGAFEQCVNMTITATDVPDLSNVENMTSMFKDCHSFNQSINNWDVSNVTNMGGMFHRAYQFNQPLDDWDVSNVTNMSLMFYEAGEFNQPIDDWDVSGVTNMSLMFHGANLFNQPLNNWDVSNVTNMNRVFSSTETFDQDLSNWDVSNVTNMEQMFWASLSFNGDISTWDVSNVTNMKEMFSGAESFNQSLNDWNVSNVTIMSQMFGGAIVFNQPLNDWDVSNVTDMSGIFAYADAFNQPLNDWDVSSVIFMSGMFMSADAFNQPLNDWDTSAATTMQNMFNFATAFNQPLNNWSVSNVTNMSSMFEMAQAFNHSLNNWDVSNVSNTKRMFNNASSYNQPLNNWDVSAVSNMMEMFNSAESFNQPLDSWEISNVTDMKSMFGNASAFNQDISPWDFNPGVIFGAFGSNAFLSNSGMNTANYDALLLKFAELELEGKSFAANEIYYCNSGVHDYLENVLDWNINDEGLGADCQGNSVVGNILFDSDSNGCDSEDVAIDTFLVNASNGTFDYVTSVTDGQYGLNVLEDTYTIQLLNLPDYFTATPASSEITFEGFGNEETLNFCLTANETIADLNITLLPLGEARPGFPAEYQLVVQNMGTQTITDATVTLTFDDALLSFAEANPAPVSSVTGQLTFEIEDLQPLESNMVDIQMEVFAPPTVNGGEIANFTATVSSGGSDNTPADNTFMLEQEIVNSYDPNDKRVLQGEWIYEEQTGEYLNYIIRFQNTGTASAITVRIEDILHENLDWTTLMPVSASHDYRVEITDGNHVKFIFDNINLPHEEADEAGSNGFIAYKIRPMADVQAGDSMSGNASIFFDFNLPIITNTVTTEVILPMVVTPAQTNVSCNGENNGSASVSVSEGWGNYTYLWSPSGGNGATANGLSAGEYTVTVTDETGDSIIVDFTITQPGAIAITEQPQDDEIVAGGNAEFGVEASNVEEYQWQVSTNGTDWADIIDGGTAPAYSGAGTDELSVTNVPVGHDGYLYRAVLVNGTDCTTYSSEAELSVTEIVTNTILAVNDDFSEQTILEGTGGTAGDVTANDLFNGTAVDDTSIIITVTNNGGLTDVAIDAEGNLTVPATAQDGTYTVTYSICEAADDTNCSTATAIVEVSAISGIEDHKLTGLTLYPNPASERLYLEADNNIQVRGVVIYNMQGRRMLSFAGQAESFDVSSLSAGIYMVEVKTDNGSAQYKLVKN